MSLQEMGGHIFPQSAFDYLQISMTVLEKNSGVVSRWLLWSYDFRVVFVTGCHQWLASTVNIAILPIDGANGLYSAYIMIKNNK